MILVAIDQMSSLKIVLVIRLTLLALQKLLPGDALDFAAPAPAAMQPGTAGGGSAVGPQEDICRLQLAALQVGSFL